MHSSSGVWGWVVLGYLRPEAGRPGVWVKNHCAVFCVSVQLKVAAPGRGRHVALNVPVPWPRGSGVCTVDTHWGGRCWSRPPSWPWRSQRSVWGPADLLGCCPSAAAPGSDSPTPPWRPGGRRRRMLWVSARVMYEYLSNKSRTNLYHVQQIQQSIGFSRCFCRRLYNTGLNILFFSGDLWCFSR